MKNLVLLLLIFLCFSYSSFATIAEDYIDEVQQKCGEDSTLLGKKLLIQIIKLQQQGKKPCEVDAVITLAKSCRDVKCQEFVELYEKAQEKNSGSVFGR